MSKNYGSWIAFLVPIPARLYQQKNNGNYMDTISANFSITRIYESGLFQFQYLKTNIVIHGMQVFTHSAAILTLKKLKRKKSHLHTLKKIGTCYPAILIS